MAATVKPIEAKAVHLIQSGQVIVDLCSVVKELVENSIDAGATAIEVRFKNNGLDEIEVQDNGSGIAPANYENLALKHYTSKLSTYDDLSHLSTFGFRGEALSSLCALSHVTVNTAQADEAPKGTHLEFEPSGKLSSTSIVACQKGTTVSISDLFDKLPVRRRELAKNIKREYAKVLGVLHAYACISTNVKFTVKNAMPKAKSMVVFATKSNSTTRENIANVYGAKSLSGLAILDLAINFQRTDILASRQDDGQMKVLIKGHISKPVFGEGRQAPDRQMFFVNGRPCGLPQIAKAINEVYRSFNVSQSPFVFADFQMDTDAYDVNVSPDKRSIFLHDAAKLTDTLKTKLTSMFDNHDQTVPQSQFQTSKLPAFKHLAVNRTDSAISAASSRSSDNGPKVVSIDTTEVASSSIPDVSAYRVLKDHFRDIVSTREEPSARNSDHQLKMSEKSRERRAEQIALAISKQDELAQLADEYDSVDDLQDHTAEQQSSTEGDTSLKENIHVRDFNARMIEEQAKSNSRNGSTSPQGIESEPPINALHHSATRSSSGIVQQAFDRMRPKRAKPETATITIGDKTIIRELGSQAGYARDVSRTESSSSETNGRNKTTRSLVQQFSQRLGQFTAPDTQTRFELERVEECDRHTTTRSLRPADSASSHELEGGNDSSEEAEYPEQNSDESPSASGDEELVDATYTERDKHRIEERARVAELIAQAEEAAANVDKDNEKRAAQILRGGRSKESVSNSLVTIDYLMDTMRAESKSWFEARYDSHQPDKISADAEEIPELMEEERLSLTVSKADFGAMQIVGQFNLGFILAVRRREREETDTQGIKSDRNRDELFIIDQHASDEIYNFERLQAETVVGNQRMVRPVTLDLTVIEEEVLLNNHEALEKNGFIVNIDTSGDVPIGRRCELVSLPLSKEAVFNTRDLDELIHLLNETPMLSDSSFVPRPSKVRKMFAMRACRSSIMIGRTLSKTQMSTVLQHMGNIDKPWNCPHGRPTMRHLTSLEALDRSLWHEGDGVLFGHDPTQRGLKSVSDTWKGYVT